MAQKQNKKRNPVDLVIAFSMIIGVSFFLYTQHKTQEEILTQEASITKYEYIFERYTRLLKNGEDVSKIKDAVENSLMDHNITNREFETIKKQIEIVEGKLEKRTNLKKLTDEELKKELLKEKLSSI